jgi:phosphatidate cytidylyltransferase
MTADAALPLLTIFSWLGIVLVLAGSVGMVLRYRAGQDVDTPVLDNFNSRIKAWWVMIAILGVAFALGQGAIIALFALCSFNALREFLTLTKRNRADHWALAASFFLVLPLQYISIWNNWYGFYAIFIPVYAFLGLPILSVLRQRTDHFLTRISETQWALMISIYCVSYVPALLSLNIPGFEGRNILLLAFLILVVQSSDVLQYIWGKLFGTLKIAPNVSPSKTWEGFVGGVLSASLIGASLWWITPFGPIEAFGMSLAITMMGFFGGLVMSAIKRDRGIKDWGHTIKGHGGFLDRLDSVVFAAPVFFHLTRFFWETMP